MFLQQLDLTTALRPSLLPDETLLFVQNGVGLYGGKLKLPAYQNGHAYLTSHRACYIDDGDPRSKAVAISLKDVEQCDLTAGFIKTSPKVTLVSKAARGQRSGSVPVAGTGDVARSATPSLGGSPRPQSLNATWVCPICSFSNPVPTNFDPTTANDNAPLSPCQSCGIKPPLVVVSKAAIAAIAKRMSAQTRAPPLNDPVSSGPNTSGATTICARCTFHNHPSLLYCEICGAPLKSSVVGQNRLEDSRSSSPAPISAEPDSLSIDYSDVKFSFRSGGEKIFVDRLKGALVQRKWLLQGAPSLSHAASSSGPSTPVQRRVGIAGLERRDMELRKTNEVVIGNAFEDLEALMASAKEIIALAERFAGQVGTPQDSTQSNTMDANTLLSQLNHTTKDMLGGGSSNSSSLYLTELSRSLAEFLTDDRTGVLRSEGGIMSLVDLWAIFNRTRGGVELVSPTDFQAAVELFAKLDLPVRLRKFRSGLLVVQERGRSDEKTVKALLDWMRIFKQIPPATMSGDHVLDQDDQLWRTWGKGVTAQDVAERFGWSLGVANEELEMAEERGALCRDNAPEGVAFWENYLADNSTTEQVTTQEA